MNRGAIGAIMAKDLREFSRDRFFVVISVLGLVFYVAIFWFLPDTVDETVRIGAGGDPALATVLTGAEGSDGLVAEAFSDEDDLVAAVEAGDDIVAGLWFPEGFAAELAAGGTPTVTVYVGSDLPPELEPALSALVRELALEATGAPLPVETLPEDQVVVGPDRVGDQVSVQQQLRPMFAFLVLLVEAITLGALVAGEIQSRTVTAVVTTPASVTDFLTAKVLFGTGLAFVQAMILLVAIRALGFAPLIMVTAILLGSVLVTGFALLAGSIGKDFMSVLFWSVAFMIPLLVPSFAVLFPGSAAPWVRVLPSYPLVQVILDVTAYEATWSDVAADLALLAGWCAVVITVGWVALRRRIVTLQEA